MGLFDGGARKAQRKNEDTYEWIKAKLPQLLSMTGKDFEAGLAALEEALFATKEGFGQARTAVSGAGRTGFRRIMENQERQVGQLGGALASSGLFGSPGVNAQRAIFSDTNREVGDLSEGIGALQGNLFAQEGQALAGGLRSIADYYRSQAGLKTQIGLGVGGLMSNFQFQGGKSLFDQIAPLAGAAVGSFGGPAGAAAGYSLGSQMTGQLGR